MMLARAVLLILASSVMAGGLPPDDEGRLNAFADAYNAYVLALKSGERGIDKWKRVERAWERLNK
ncbi:MAG: hypothetical protein IPK75_18370 [Acidobacteria bacterium]|nr:hypothetical protein [Acidobacteriota bacterium]